jgi:phosphatidylserine/phosphatidylglycerophosphate/cardiolipin synthase-like enzyme
VTRLAAAVLVAAMAALPAAAREGAAATTARVEAAFTPGDDIAALLVRRIGAARNSVHLQAYLFTDRRIANALLAARRRGVEVHIVADAAQHAAGGLPFLAALDRAGAHVHLNAAHAAMHNKIVILDAGRPAAAVITGSYNFTPSAQARNAENVVVLSGSRALAQRFLDHFEQQRSRSTPWRSASTSPP